MKRFFNSLLIAMLVLATPTVNGKNLSLETVKDAAVHYMQHNTSLVRLTADQLTLDRTWVNPSTQEATMYLFTTSGEGWIIMTAVSSMDPVVAYSDDSEFNVDCVPESLEWWLGNYNKMVCEAQNYEVRDTLPEHPEWSQLINHELKGNTKDTQVRLMFEKWDQGSINGDDYNMYSPVIRDTVCPTGCVATAMSQIMHYYKYPVQPKGYVKYKPQELGEFLEITYDDSVGFDYSIMPNQISKYSTPTEQRKEISRLQYFAGVAVYMDYAPSGSGTQSNKVPTAMKGRFKYELGQLKYRSQMGDSVFMSTLRESLLNKNPLYMSGSSSVGGNVHAAGHAWVCCGYRTENTKMYFMNWGWDGTGNGYFNLYDNDMPLQVGYIKYNFNKGQAAIFGMTPPADSLLAIESREKDEAFMLGKAYPNPASSQITLPYYSRENADLQIFAVDGRMVMSKSVRAGEGDVVISIDALPAGVYIYRLGSSYGKFVRK